MVLARQLRHQKDCGAESDDDRVAEASDEHWWATEVGGGVGGAVGIAQGKWGSKGRRKDKVRVKICK